MNIRHSSVIAAVPAALLFACAAGAQQRPPQTPPQPEQPAMPMTTQTNPNMNMSGNGARNGNETFSSLAGPKGYVTRSDAASDPWLANHFAECDTDHNGRITRSEYNHCHRQQP
ncbi:MAG TPA: hypothetical protein VKV22_03680 [Rhodanobacteraceae bacterium]|nr:hypothetical protein [Rhodanobacteraceae bacterium]